MKLMTSEFLSMDSTLPRRFTGTPESSVDGSAHLQKLLSHISKRKTEKSRHQPNDYDSGVECNTEAEFGAKFSQLDVSKSDNSNSSSKQHDDDDVSDERVPIIGGHDFSKTKKVVASLPKWLAQPIVVSTDLSNHSVKVKKFKLFDELLVRNLKDNGVKYLFPVQAEVIPWLLRSNCRESLSTRCTAPRDLCVSAPTGSGKTLAYVLPIVQSLKDRLVPKIRALVVVPVQELALQIHEVFKKYCKGTKLKVEVTTGGKTELREEQLKLVRKIVGCGRLESKIDILVTTPGRLVEHLNYTEGFDVTDLKYLVIDEADRIMENVQDNWLHILERHTGGFSKFSSIVSVGTIRKRRAPQKLLFSATLSHDPEKLKQLGLFQPVLFTSLVKDSTANAADDYVGKYTTPRELEEFYLLVQSKLKPLVLCALVDRGWNKILCFAKSVEDAHKLSHLLGLMMSDKTVKELSSKLSRKGRDDTLKEFAEGKVDVLVCSDVIARGLDIPGVRYVVSYDPPKHVEGYIHRVGRTGRAGCPGTALTLLDPDGQKDAFMQKLLNVNKLDVQQMTIAEEVYLDKMQHYKIALAQLKSAVEIETVAQKNDLKRKKRNKANQAKKQKR